MVYGQAINKAIAQPLTFMAW